MRIYYIETLNDSGTWEKFPLEFENCRKAHSVARSIRSRPARVLMLMRKLELADLRTALHWQASHASA